MRLLAAVADTSRCVAETSSGQATIETLAACLRTLSLDLVVIAAAWGHGRRRGDCPIGISVRVIRRAAGT